MRQFDTSIKKIMVENNKYNLNHASNTIFLSNWDTDIDTKPYGVLFDDNFLNNKKAKINTYYYWTDEQGYSLIFEYYYRKYYNQKINPDTFLIGNNGTSSIMLSLMALSEQSINRILVFTPIYFCTLNLLELLKFQVYRYDLRIENNFQINFKHLEKYIKNNRIEALFITDPVFGTGVEHNLKTYIELATMAQKYNLSIVIDYVYGGMIWNDDNFIFNNKSFYIINNIPNTIFIESIPKRIFINGIKFSLVFSSPTLIRKIKRLSIYTTGSMCLNQLEIFKNIYNLNNIKVINNIIRDNLIRAQNTYNKIYSFLIGKNCIISKCNSSFFLILGLPKAKDENDVNIAIKIIQDKGILTIPHSRYLLENDKYYFFRINLLLDDNIIFEGLTKLLS